MRDVLSATEEEMRDPEYCYACGCKCGSKPHK
jgi:hypothetical protein